MPDQLAATRQGVKRNAERQIGCFALIVGHARLLSDKTKLFFAGG
jgi:hypothetical protein